MSVQKKKCTKFQVKDYSWGRTNCDSYCFFTLSCQFHVFSEEKKLLRCFCHYCTSMSMPFFIHNLIGNRSKDDLTQRFSFVNSLNCIVDIDSMVTQPTLATAPIQENRARKKSERITEKETDREQYSMSSTLFCEWFSFDFFNLSFYCMILHHLLLLNEFLWHPLTSNTHFDSIQLNGISIQNKCLLWFST